MPTAEEVRTGWGRSMEAGRGLTAVCRQNGSRWHSRRKTGPDGSVESIDGANSSVEATDGANSSVDATDGANGSVKATGG